MKRSWRGKLVLLTFILLLVLGNPSPVRAQSLVYGDTIPQGMVVDQDIVLIGQNVTIDGTVNGNVIVLGNQVAIRGVINGSLILLSQNAVIGGRISGGVYVAALTLELAAPAMLGRDLYLVTVSVESAPNSTIQRDLFAITLDAGLNGQVGRNLHTSIGPIQLYNSLMRLLGFEELTIKLHFEFQPSSSAPNLSPAGKKGPGGSAGSQTAILRLAPAAFIQEPAFDWSGWGLNLTRDWIVLLVLSLLAVWLARKPLEISGAPLRAHPWRTTALGLLVFIISLNLFALAALLAAVFFALGLAMNYLGLWQLSIAVWIVVYSCLALALTLLWFFIAYGTKIVVIYLVFTWLSDKVNSSLGMKVAAILVGTLVYTLLRSAPYVGWVIDVLVTAGGLGTAWLAYRAIYRQPVPEILPSVQTPGRRPARQSAQ